MTAAPQPFDAGLDDAGALVFRVTLPLTICPTMNAYASWKPWQRARARREIMVALNGAAWTALPGEHQWRAPWLGIVRGPSSRRGMLGPVVREGESRKRRVVVTRRSARQPDEVSCDTLGGKMPIDALVRAGILRDDSPRWLERVARWERATGAEQGVRVEVYECDPWEMLP